MEREGRGSKGLDEARRHPSFGEVYEDHIWSVYGFFGYRVRSRADAEDLTQLTFERAIRAWDRFDPDRASARTWLMSIAHNLLIDHYRRDRTGKLEPLDAHHSAAETAAAEDEVGLAPEIASALELLTERERQLIALRFGGELTGSEIAELTGLSLANVQQLLSRSLRKMRAELDGRSGF